MEWDQRFTNCKNLKFWKTETPRGFRIVQKWFLDRTSSSFLLYLLKTRNIITFKYSQNYFESTFGWTNILPTNSKLKLVFKELEKEPRKASIPWDIGLIWGHQIWITYISQYKFLDSKETTIHSTRFTSTFTALKNDNFP